MSEHHHGNEVLEPLTSLGRALRDQIPEVYSGFARLSSAAMADGELDRKTKELIALAISVVNRCDGCIASHAKGAARAKASEAEVAEALGVAIALSGGPGTSYAPRAFDAFKEFAQS